MLPDEMQCILALRVLGTSRFPMGMSARGYPNVGGLAAKVLEVLTMGATQVRHGLGRTAVSGRGDADGDGRIRCFREELVGTPSAIFRLCKISAQASYLVGKI